MEALSVPAIDRVAVAMQMIRFEARTRTIRLSTKLTDDQIRRLYRQNIHNGTVSTRHRGRSPQQALQYTRNSQTHLESSIFASVLAAHGLLKGMRPKPWLGQSLHYAHRFCIAYARYLQLAMHDPLSFEQAWYFARMLAARSELYLQQCKHCGSHYLGDNHTVLKRDCPVCRCREKMAKDLGETDIALPPKTRRRK